MKDFKLTLSVPDVTFCVSDEYVYVQKLQRQHLGLFRQTHHTTLMVFVESAKHLTFDALVY